jgi:glycosyltransferase involved in cell wall biosynthesis
MDNPKISIVTSTYNSSKTLKDTIDSVLNQSYKNIEYIIIDGDSTDNTVEIIKTQAVKFKEKNRFFTWLSEPDTGIYNAWNKALNLVSGDWIVFIGSDDYFVNNTVIEKTIPVLSKVLNNNIRFIYGKIEHVNKQKLKIEVSGKSWEEQKKRFTYTMNIGHTGSFHHNSLFEDHGEFNETFKIVGDYEFLLRELKDPERDAFFLNSFLVVMREGGVSASLKNRLTLVKENQKARKLNGITSFSKELFFWEIRVRVILFFSKLFGENFASKLADFYRKLSGKEKRWSA